VKMVSEGVDIPRLMVAVYATNTIATLFFRQFVGRVVRVRHRGMEEVASVYLPGDERLTSEAEKIEAEVQQFLRDEPAKFPAVRNAIADRQKQRANIVPMMRSIERDPSIYRGETFTEAELSRAEALRPSWPLGDRLSAAQIAFAIRQVEAGAA
jgi:superfamily II DNA or RNA helicase